MLVSFVTEFCSAFLAFFISLSICAFISGLSFNPLYFSLIPEIVLLAFFFAVFFNFSICALPTGDSNFSATPASAFMLDLPSLLIRVSLCFSLIWLSICLGVKGGALSFFRPNRFECSILLFSGDIVLKILFVFVFASLYFFSRFFAVRRSLNPRVPFSSFFNFFIIFSFSTSEIVASFLNIGCPLLSNFSIFELFLPKTARFRVLFSLSLPLFCSINCERSFCNFFIGLSASALNFAFALAIVSSIIAASSGEEALSRSFFVKLVSFSTCLFIKLSCFFLKTPFSIFLSNFFCWSGVNLVPSFILCFFIKALVASSVTFFFNLAVFFFIVSLALLSASFSITSICSFDSGVPFFCFSLINSANFFFFMSVVLVLLKFLVCVSFRFLISFFFLFLSFTLFFHFVFFCHSF